MQCTTCGAWNAEQLTRCEHCGRSLRAPRARLPQPSRFQVENDGVRLEIRWRWFHPMAIFLLFFAIAWNAFLIGWYAMASQAPGWFGVIFLVFPLAHVAVGIGVSYFVLASFLNSTRILVDRGELSVQHSPIYFPGSVTLPTSDIEQVYVSQAFRPGHGVPSGERGVSVGVFQLNLLTKSQRQIVLLKHLPSLTDAEYLEQELERMLKIVDAPVAGSIAS